MTHVIELAAVVTSAMYGILRGTRQGFDLVGICCLAFVVAFGGGTLRDLLLDRHPVFWIASDDLPWIVFALAVGGAFTPQTVSRLEFMLWIPDAFGLGLFSVLGAMLSLDCGTSRFVAVLMGVITGSFGGVIADVVCNELPLVFARSPLYATCSFIGGVSFILLDALGVRETTSMGTEILVTAFLRIAAVRWNLCLPSRSLQTNTFEEKC